MQLWIKNTDGKPDAVLTMTLMGFIVVLMKFLVSNIVLNVAGHEITFGAADASAIGAMLTPTLGAYVARRYTDRKFSADKTQDVQDEPQGKPQE
jgi:hypothetical protein